LVKPTFRPERFVPLSLGGKRIGWVRPELAAHLASWPKVFATSPDRVALLDPDGLAAAVEQLAEEGFIPGWRNERYRIDDLFDIERAAARPFGLTTQAVHLNGIVGERMWLARRSATKPIDPGLLDNLVGGGVSVGFSIQETLGKEAWEEAGIPAQLAARATRGGTVRILREVPEGVQSEIVHVFDLALPEAFEPRNQDGEVSEYLLVSFQDIEKHPLTLEAELATKDYFSRARAP
jgi:8-oxo-dGTP pyrophosphatase MutT (NUDIX family)